MNETPQTYETPLMLFYRTVHTATGKPPTEEMEAAWRLWRFDVGEEEFNKWYNERKIIAPTHFVVVGSFLEKLVDKFEKI